MCRTLLWMYLCLEYFQWLRNEMFWWRSRRATNEHEYQTTATTRGGDKLSIFLLLWLIKCFILLRSKRWRMVLFFSNDAKPTSRSVGWNCFVCTPMVILDWTRGREKPAKHYNSPEDWNNFLILWFFAAFNEITIFICQEDPIKRIFCRNRIYHTGIHEGRPSSPGLAKAKRENVA